MEYPELKRAVREQYERYRPSVVLIEDKASGTQLFVPASTAPWPPTARSK
jgi:phage terminase large subunit-like protein